MLKNGNYSPAEHFGQKHITFGIKMRPNRLFAPQMVFSRSGQTWPLRENTIKNTASPFPILGRVLSPRAFFARMGFCQKAPTP